MRVVWRVVASRPRLFAGAACGVAVLLGQWAVMGRMRPIIAWDVGAMVYLALAAVLFFKVTEPSAMARNAAAQQEGEWTIFALEVGAAAASFSVILNEFTAISALHGTDKGLRLALVALTLFVSWLMTQVSFAVRYAHEYYEKGQDGEGYRRGLEFPGEPSPDYLDFVYFAVVVGMTFQVSDVQITARHLRRLAALQGLVAFLFNTIILALTVNLVAGLL